MLDYDCLDWRSANNIYNLLVFLIAQVVIEMLAKKDALRLAVSIATPSVIIAYMVFHVRLQAAFDWVTSLLQYD